MPTATIVTNNTTTLFSPSTTKLAPLPIPHSQPKSHQTQTQTQTLDPTAALTDSQRWFLLSTRSVAHTPTPPFIYGVLSTKIYCRPSCPARLARRANVVFFDTADQAEHAGFRACRRCRPDVVVSASGGEDVVIQQQRRQQQQPGQSQGQGESDSTGAGYENPSLALGSAAAPVDASGTGNGTAVEATYVAPGDGEQGRRKVIRAVEIIRRRAEEQGEKVSLAELAGEVGLSKWHLLRVFRKRWGVSPREMGEGVLSAAAAAAAAKSSKKSRMWSTDRLGGEDDDDKNKKSKKSKMMKKAESGSESEGKVISGDGKRRRSGYPQASTTSRASGGERQANDDQDQSAKSGAAIAIAIAIATTPPPAAVTGTNSTGTETTTTTTTTTTSTTATTPSTADPALDREHGRGYQVQDPILTFEESLLNFEAMDMDMDFDFDMDFDIDFDLNIDLKMDMDMDMNMNMDMDMGMEAPLPALWSSKAESVEEQEKRSQKEDVLQDLFPEVYVGR